MGQSFPASLLGDPKEQSATWLKSTIDEVVFNGSEYVILWSFMLCQTSLNIYMFITLQLFIDLCAAVHICWCKTKK